MLEELDQLIGPFRDKLALIGGVAYNFWCEPRFTKDVDFNVIADATVFVEIRKALEGAGWESTRYQDEGGSSGPEFVRFVVPGTRKMVEFQAAKTPFQELIIERAVVLNGDQPFPVATREDVIVLKLIASRPQDRADAVGLASGQGLDWGYMEHWADVWDVSDRLQGLRQMLAEEAERLGDLFQAR